MNAIYNDSILEELRKMTEKEKMNECELLNVGIKIKQRVWDTTNSSTSLQNAYRYVVHLQNGLINKKRISIKKKYRTSL